MEFSQWTWELFRPQKVLNDIHVDNEPCVICSLTNGGLVNLNFPLGVNMCVHGGMVPCDRLGNHKGCILASHPVKDRMNKLVEGKHKLDHKEVVNKHLHRILTVVEVWVKLWPNTETAGVVLYSRNELGNILHCILHTSSIRIHHYSF